MFDALREVEIPLLAVLLLAGSVAKAASRYRRGTAVLGPTVLVAQRWHRPAVLGTAALEAVLGVGLLVAKGTLATLVRLGTVVLFLTATFALVELRARRPDAGCGCFGELSSTPVGVRAVTRAALLALAALGTIGVGGSGVDVVLALSRDDTVMLLAAIAVLAALSPELRQAYARLRHRAPCELRRVPVCRTFAALRASAAWRDYGRLLTAAEPVDVWRELCWRYVVYPGVMAGRAVEVVFAVHLEGKRPPVRAAVVDAATGEALAGPDDPDPALARGASPVDRVRTGPCFRRPHVFDFLRLSSTVARKQ